MGDQTSGSGTGQEKPSDVLDCEIVPCTNDKENSIEETTESETNNETTKPELIKKAKEEIMAEYKDMLDTLHTCVFSTLGKQETERMLIKAVDKLTESGLLESLAREKVADDDQKDEETRRIEKRTQAINMYPMRVLSDMAQVASRLY